MDPEQTMETDLEKLKSKDKGSDELNCTKAIKKPFCKTVQ